MQVRSDKVSTEGDGIVPTSSPHSPLHVMGRSRQTSRLLVKTNVTRIRLIDMRKGKEVDAVRGSRQRGSHYVSTHGRIAAAEAMRYAGPERVALVCGATDISSIYIAPDKEV